MIKVNGIYVVIFVALGLFGCGTANAQDSQTTQDQTATQEAPAPAPTGEAVAPEAAPAAGANEAAAAGAATGTEGVAVATAQPPAQHAPNIVISDGSKIDVAGKGFSIIPPVGWEVRTDMEGISLVMQIPYQPGIYQRTIQVAHGHEVYAMNHQSAEEAVKVIVAKRGASSGVIQNYTLDNQQFVSLEDGSEAMTFYTNFLIGDVKMMEMHMLVGDANGHFLVTYTDVAENFNVDKNKKYIDDAFKCMMSLKPANPATSQFELFVYIGVGLLAVSFLVLLVNVYRKYRMQGLLRFDGNLDSDMAPVSQDAEMLDDNDVYVELDLDDDEEMPRKKVKAKAQQRKVKVQKPEYEVSAISEMQYSVSEVSDEVSEHPVAKFSLDIDDEEELLDDSNFITGLMKKKEPAQVSEDLFCDDYIIIDEDEVSVPALPPLPDVSRQVRRTKEVYVNKAKK